MSEKCGDCLDCPFVAWKQSLIAAAEEQRQSVIDHMAGTAQLYVESTSPDHDNVALAMEIVKDGLDTAIANRAETGKALIVRLLAGSTQFAKRYFDYVDYMGGQIEKDQKAIELAQSTCHGPAKKREHFLFGSWVWLCTGQKSFYDRAASKGLLNLHKR